AGLLQRSSRWNFRSDNARCGGKVSDGQAARGNRESFAGHAAVTRSAAGCKQRQVVKSNDETKAQNNEVTVSPLGNSTTAKGNCMNTKRLSDKVALVTGGTSGIGKTTATEFARAGAKVVLSGRREKEGAQVVAEIKKLGGEAAFVRADVAKDADVQRMVDFTVDKFGRLDIAFNNAGVEWIGPLDQATEAEYRRIFDINVWGVLNSMRH